MDEHSLDELSGIAEAMIPLIRNKVTAIPAIFNLWFGGLRLVSLTDTKATFTTPSDLRKNILTTQYKDVIVDTLETVIGFRVDIEVYADADSAKQKKPVSDESLDDIDAETVKEGREEERRVAEYINSSSDKKSLLDDYTFENFVEGSSNKFARAACYAVAREPNTYNPLFIYGHSGLGKTHLLYAVINYMRKNHPDLKIIYKKCETFLDELIKAIKSGTTAAFKEKY